MKYKILNIAALLALPVLATVCAFSVNTVTASAATSAISNDSRTNFNALCDGLKAVGTSGSQRIYNENCKSYIKLSDQDSAASAICNIYGNARLKSECDTYENKATASNTSTAISGNSHPTNDGHTCGGDDSNVHTAINIGCRAKGNAVLDATFAIIRFLSNGVGFALIGSLIYAGIQYTASSGNPQNIAAAENRIKAVMMALLIYVFAYTMLNYLIPGKLLQ